MWGKNAICSVNNVSDFSILFYFDDLTEKGSMLLPPKPILIKLLDSSQRLTPYLVIWLLNLYQQRIYQIMQPKIILQQPKREKITKKNRQMILLRRNTIRGAVTHWPWANEKREPWNCLLLIWKNAEVWNYETTPSITTSIIHCQNSFDCRQLLAFVCIIRGARAERKLPVQSCSKTWRAFWFHIFLGRK